MTFISNDKDDLDHADDDGGGGDDDDDDGGCGGLYVAHLVPLGLMEWKVSLCTLVGTLSMQYKFAFYAGNTEV
jgi:hypothetical protein